MKLRTDIFILILDSLQSSLHPSVLEKFEIPYPVSAVEINLEAFL